MSRTPASSLRASPETPPAAPSRAFEKVASEAPNYSRPPDLAPRAPQAPPRSSATQGRSSPNPSPGAMTRGEPRGHRRRRGGGQVRGVGGGAGRTCAGPGGARAGGRLPVGGRGKRAGRARSAGACCRSWTAGGSPSSPWSTAWGVRGAPGGRGGSALAASLGVCARPASRAPSRSLLLRASPPPRGAR